MHEVEDKEDGELEALGCSVLRAHGVRPGLLLEMLQGAGIFGDTMSERVADPGWTAISQAERRMLLRLDRLCEMFPGVPAGSARAFARNPALAVVDRTRGRVVLLPDRG